MQFNKYNITMLGLLYSNFVCFGGLHCVLLHRGVNKFKIVKNMDQNDDFFNLLFRLWGNKIN